MRRPKTIYEEITQGMPQARPIWPLVLVCAVPALCLGGFRLICRDKALVNTLVWDYTSPLKHAIARLCGLLPWNTAEVCWTIGVLGAIALVGSSAAALIRCILRRRQGAASPGSLLLRRGLVILAAALWVYLGYTALWGINYYADTFSERSGLEGRRTTAAELSLLLNAFADACNDSASQVSRDAEGLFAPDWETVFQRSLGQYAALYGEFPCLDLEESTPRPMFWSKIMSALGFTGFYFPFTGESLVNVDAPAALVPATILHELAHQRNVAPEDEANFLAVVVGLHSADAEFRYSSALMGYIHLSNALYDADRDLWREADSRLSEQVRTDLRYNNAFWRRHDTPAADAAEAVYSSFARSYGQEDIMKSYGACVDLIAAYYLPKEGS